MIQTGVTASILAIRKAQDGGHAEISVTDESVDQIIWHAGNPTNITNQQILDKEAELQVQYDAEQYKRDRTARPKRGGYPSIEDQMDMQYHDLVDGTTTWKDAVKAIKDAHPKP